MKAQLSEIQRVMRSAITQFDSLVDNAEHGAAVETITTGNDRLSPRQHADIYREQYWLRHRDVLYEDFPALAYLLGDEAFEPFCRDFLAAHPPDSYTLRDLGEHVPAYATGYDSFDPRYAQLAKDTARYERLFTDLFDGPDVPAVDPAQLQTLTPAEWSRAKLRLHPLLRLEQFAFPVNRLRENAKSHNEVPDNPKLPPLEERLVDPKVTRLCMYRGADLKVHYMPMKASAFELARALAAGISLVEACDQVASTIPAEQQGAFASELSSWFEQWARRGWIVDVDCSETSDPG